MTCSFCGRRLVLLAGDQVGCPKCRGRATLEFDAPNYDSDEPELENTDVDDDDER